MKLKTLLEAPLIDIEYHKADNKHGGSFSPADRKLIQKFIAQKTYHEKLKNLPIDFYVYIIDSDGLEEIGKSYPEGIIDDDALMQGFYSPSSGNEVDLTTPEFHTVLGKIKQRFKEKPKSIHFIMGDNYAENKIGMTPWMLVHRWLHGANLGYSNSTISSISSYVNAFFVDCDFSEQALRALPNMLMMKRSMLTFKSASLVSKDGNPSTEGTELGIDCVTQYLLTGKNRLDFSKLEEYVKTHVKHMPEDKLQARFEELKKSIEGVLKDLQQTVDIGITKSLGKIYYI